MGAELAVIPSGQTELAASFMPVMAMQQAIQRYNALLSFTQEIMKPGKDYGTIPGVEKPSLFKPGAEKLCNFFGLTPKFVVVKEAEQWEGEEPFFYYWYKCQLWRGSNLIAEADGSCNSRESKYRYRWVNEDLVPPGLNKTRLVKRAGRATEPEFAIEKGETSGKYGKPAEYWQSFRDAIAAGTAVSGTRESKAGAGRPMKTWSIESTVYRVPNPDISDQVNTIQKMAQKRAMVAVTLIGCNASEYFTQDIEDMQAIDVPYTVSHEAPASQAAAPKHAEPGPKPSTLDQILATFKSKAEIASAFSQMREDFCQVLDEAAYQMICDEFKVDDRAKEFGTVGNAKKCFTKLWEAYKAQLAVIDAIPAEEPAE